MGRTKPADALHRLYAVLVLLVKVPVPQDRPRLVHQARFCARQLGHRVREAEVQRDATERRQRELASDECELGRELENMDSQR